MKKRYTWIRSGDSKESIQFYSKTQEAKDYCDPDIMLIVSNPYDTIFRIL